ncbi:MAG: MBL fold metallo-hydrolase, partial [Parafannyhessea umbonata]|uniref:MBL fold metallo-hydrolase n=1 Tax=Parafannyhessea umbonata TaxID=604330 RepID=UPI0026EC5235
MTPKMHLYVLASGSKGNAAVVEGPQGSVLIDCGISRRELMRRADACGCDLGRVTHVLVTHEHSDHTRGLPVLSNHFDGELLATAGTAGGAKPLASLPFTLVTHSETLRLAGMVVTTFPTSHDVADPFGLRFSVLDADGQIEDSIGWCTDTGYLTAEALGQLRGVRILGLESNHDVQMLAHGPYPAWLRARVGGDAGHLSNDQAADALPLLVTQD